MHKKEMDNIGAAYPATVITERSGRGVVVGFPFV